MSQDHSPSHADIGAWVDGELPGDAAMAMQRKAGADPALAAAAQRIRALDDLVRQAVPHEEAIPADLLTRLGLTPGAPSAAIVSLAAAREARRTPPARPLTNGWPMPRMAASLALLTGLGLALAVWQAPGSDNAAYRTLSNGVAAAPANAVVIFASDVDAATARAIAAAAGASLVGAPNSAGAWQVMTPPARRDAVLASLRADRRVVLAQPLDAGAS